MTNRFDIPDDRDLTIEEVNLVCWLLNHGFDGALDFLSQLEKARVDSRCSCGCASINFAIDGIKPLMGPVSILSEYDWINADGHLMGVFVFERSDLLAGLEVWSQDGLTIPQTLPLISHLRPISTGRTME